MYHRSQIQPLSISVSKAFPRFHPSFPVRREPIVSGNGTHNPAYIAVGNAKSLDLNLFFSALRLVCSTAWIQPSCTLCLHHMKPLQQKVYHPWMYATLLYDIFERCCCAFIFSTGRCHWKIYGRKFPPTDNFGDQNKWRECAGVKMRFYLFMW